MEVRKDFAKRVSALAGSTPREAVANLLKSMLPREPVRMREPIGLVRRMQPDGTLVPDYAPLQRDPFAPKRPVRVRRMRTQEYEVLDKHNRARRGSKRWKQLNIVLENTNTRAARLAGAESVDLSFAVDEGYIRLID